MTANMITGLPAAALGAMLASLGRSLIWTASRILGAPLASAVLIMMVVGSAFSAANALFLQADRHPAPLFTNEPMITASVTPRPTHVRVAPAKKLPTPSSAVVAKPVIVVKPVEQVKAPVLPLISSPEPVVLLSNDDIRALQQKLAALKFLDTEADGFYGPKTATAIRAFESQTGQKPLGALSRELLDAVLAAKLPTTPKAEIAPILPKVDIGTPPAKATAITENHQSDLAKLIQESTAAKAPIVQNKQAIPDGLIVDPLLKIVQRVASVTQQTTVPKSPSVDTDLVKKVQRALASLGFLGGKIDGVAGENTAKAIRNFEVYYNYDVTGAVTLGLVDLLVEAGAQG